MAILKVKMWTLEPRFRVPERLPESRVAYGLEGRRVEGQS